MSRATAYTMWPVPTQKLQVSPSSSDVGRRDGDGLVDINDAAVHSAGLRQERLRGARVGSGG